ncbi:polysaccharide deacetylase family protein [Paracnuella aquatica]|uniref:polysaccharide deacetylase family protein n=1 Tax=Paracnuella aquatica TaxID=2268757 RepID=UPI000DEF8C49|nr:polysaccharide deacetylase family protein [Paracnuella aquatica]RPD46731.1 hypothetical protein DRJ53_13430 [Paracnuella aquatica]
MKQLLTTFYYRYLAPKCMVLMYHRVATPPTDVWEIAVSPKHFEEQLQVLQATGRVVPLNDMVQSIKQGKIKDKTIALTFDDAYADNITVALPLLEQYGLPATFFVTSIEKGPFWWDALEQTLLTSPHLPATLQIPMDGGSFDLTEEATLTERLQQLHRTWKPFEADAPTRRAKLYLQLWQQMRPMVPAQQQHFLQQLLQLNNLVLTAPNEIATPRQLQSLKGHRLIDIEAHTAQHPALGMHDAQFQKEQVQSNRLALEQRFGKKVSLLAYPYGHYNGDSMQVAASLNFDAAFTTNPEPITKRSHPFQLGRFQVPDCSGDAFAQKLSGWLRKY